MRQFGSVRSPAQSSNGLSEKAANNTGIVLTDPSKLVQHNYEIYAKINTKTLASLRLQKVH
jgi:hypothetical protein